MVFTIHLYPSDNKTFTVRHPHAPSASFTVTVTDATSSQTNGTLAEGERLWSIQLMASGVESMVAHVKSAQALLTTSRLKGYNSRLADFGPVYATSQSRAFACAEDHYIDILISTDMDETIIDETGRVMEL